MDNEIVVRNEAGMELGGPNARLNITVNGQNGDYPDALRYDMTDGDVKQVATEAVRTGYIPGVTAAEVNFNDFVVGALISGVAQKFLETGEKRSFHITPTSLLRLT